MITFYFRIHIQNIWYRLVEEGAGDFTLNRSEMDFPSSSLTANSATEMI